MTEQEKKAIDFLKIFSKTEIDYCKLEKADVLDILNFITKQQKEIEGWKKLHNNLSNTYDNLSNTYDNMLDIVENDFIEKDRIREKIKELSKTQAYKVGLEEYTIKILKELLEE